VVLFAVGWLLVSRLLGGPIDEVTIIQGAVIGLVFGVVEMLNLRRSKPPGGR
jgi:hypothetical protein